MEYAYVHVQKAGKEAKEILLGLDEVIKAMTFPTKMRWDSQDFEFVRPIHWLVALYGSEVVPVEFLDITAGRKTAGHRFLGDSVVLANADDYVEALRDQYVIVDADERKDMIGFPDQRPGKQPQLANQAGCHPLGRSQQPG